MLEKEGKIFGGEGASKLRVHAIHVAENYKLKKKKNRWLREEDMNAHMKIWTSQGLDKKRGEFIHDMSSYIWQLALFFLPLP